MLLWFCKVLLPSEYPTLLRRFFAPLPQAFTSRMLLLNFCTSFSESYDSQSFKLNKACWLGPTNFSKCSDFSSPHHAVFHISSLSRVFLDIFSPHFSIISIDVSHFTLSLLVFEWPLKHSIIHMIVQENDLQDTAIQLVSTKNPASIDSLLPSQKTKIKSVWIFLYRFNVRCRQCRHTCTCTPQNQTQHSDWTFSILNPHSRYTQRNA